MDNLNGMTPDQLRAGILNAMRNPEPVAGNLIPPEELDRLLTLSRQRKAGLISSYPEGVAEIDVFRAEEQYARRIMATNAGALTDEQRKNLHADVMACLRDMGQ